MLSLRYAFEVGWVCMSAFQYGYQISGLNSLQASLSCADSPDNLPRWILGHLTTSCVPLSATQFGILSSMYTIGGLVGALQGGRLADSRGRKRTLVLAAAFLGGGSAWLAVGTSLSLLIVGRLLIGFGCGLSTVVVPVFLHEMSPAHLQGSVGVLNQLSITIGIVVALALGIPFSKPSEWRLVMVICGGLSLLQLLLAPLVREPSNASETEILREREALLPSDERIGQIPLTMWQTLSAKDQKTRDALRLIAVTQMAQQLSGINAVFNYSTETLREVVPANPQAISLVVSAANCVMTVVPALLIERLGRKTLLLFSLICCATCTLFIGIGLNIKSGLLASVATAAFVSAFSFGLGAIPFLLIPEVSPRNAISAASSIGLALNWTSNAVVGVTFNPLARAMTPTFGRGGIFFLFTILSSTATLLIWRLFKPSLTRRPEAT